MCIKFPLKAKKAFNQKAENLMLLSGWVIRIRTLIDGVRVRSPAVGRSPSIFNVWVYTLNLKMSQQFS